MPAKQLVDTITPDAVRMIAILSADHSELIIARYTNNEVRALFPQTVGALNIGATVRHNGGLAFDVIMAGLEAHKAELSQVRRVSV